MRFKYAARSFAQCSQRCDSVKMIQFASIMTASDGDDRDRMMMGQAKQYSVFACTLCRSATLRSSDVCPLQNKNAQLLYTMILDQLVRLPSRRRCIVKIKHQTICSLCVVH